MMFHVIILVEVTLSDVRLLGFLSSGLGDILMAMRMVEREVSTLVKDEVSL